MNAPTKPSDPLWRPWTPLAAPPGPFIVRGEGCHVWDREGARYLDARSGALTAVCGHGHPAITEAVAAQTRRLAHYELMGAANEPAAALAAALAERLPGPLNHVFFANSGSEAVEAALRAALEHHLLSGDPGRRAVISLQAAYHGSTALTLALSGLPQTATPYDPPIPVHHLPLPADAARLRSPDGLADLDTGLRRVLASTDTSTIAALIVEPVLNVAGCLPLPAGALRLFRQVCDEIGALLIADEVFTGLGRTGVDFAVVRDQICPDLIVLSKGLTSGAAPLSAFAASGEIAAATAADPICGGLRYGHTTSGHATACAAGIACLGVIDDLQLPANAHHRGVQLGQALASVAKAGDVVDVRGVGLAHAVELATPQVAEAVAAGCQQQGVLVRAHGPAIVIAPPLTISESETSQLAEAVAGAVRATLNPVPTRRRRSGSGPARQRGRSGALDALVHRRSPARDEFAAFGRALAAGDVTDAQAGAFAAAVMLNGLDPEDLATLTTAMAGDRLPIADHFTDGLAVGKHSTGGVGDKISLVAVPTVAACGVLAPKLSGRALAHCGGTIDKVDAIGGMRTELSVDELVDQLTRHGCFIAQAGTLAAGDRALYGIRQEVHCVDSVELIASSIMAKKVAEGAQRLVLDVRSGPAGLIDDPDLAHRLAEIMVDIGARCGIATTARVTAWDRPLGAAVGAAAEVHEALAVLHNQGPADVTAEALAVAGEMLRLVGRDPDGAGAALASGAALGVFERMVAAQGGNLDAVPHPAATETVGAARAGIIEALDARAIGAAVAAMAEQGHPAGRHRDLTAGVILHKTVGDPVDANEPVATVGAAGRDWAQNGAAGLAAAIRIGDGSGTAPAPPPAKLITSTNA